MSVKPNKRKIEEWKVKLMKERIERYQQHYLEMKPYWDSIERNKPPYISDHLINEQQKLLSDAFA